MTYFNRRNKLVKEYSGYEEASESLRARIYQVITRYISRSIGIGAEKFWVRSSSLEHELTMELNNSDLSELIYKNSYGDVFTSVEIFLSLANKQAWERYRRVILPDIIRAFDLSGSVYFVNSSGEVGLRVTEDLAKKLEEAEEILSENNSSYVKFFDAVGNLMGRKDSQENIIKDLFVAFEDYLKDKTTKKEFGQALDSLKSQGVITATQKSLIEKLYAYRSDVYGVTHAGNGKAPDEVDALWYLETTVTQLKLIDRRLKN